MTGDSTDTVSLREDVKQILDSHLSVGWKKPVSYLPIRTVENVIGITVSAYKSMIERIGNKCFVFSAADCCINSGAVYAYSYTDLNNILKDEYDVLSKHRWPTVPEDFIKRMASEWIEDESPILPVIKKAFGETSSCPPENHSDEWT
jgi:hypothetical protein